MTTVNPTYYGPFGANPDISYACSICAILMKLSKIKYFDKQGTLTYFAVAELEIILTLPTMGLLELPQIAPPHYQLCMLHL